MKELKKRKFKLWAYTVSHSILILRSPMRYRDQDDYNELYSENLDLVFSSVLYLDIPTNLNGVDFELKKDNFPDKFLEFTSQGGKVFKIRSDNNDYYVVAYSLKIGRNDWGTESEISNINLQYLDILYSYPPLPH